MAREAGHAGLGKGHKIVRRELGMLEGRIAGLESAFEHALSGEEAKPVWKTPKQFCEHVDAMLGSIERIHANFPKGEEADVLLSNVLNGNAEALRRLKSHGLTVLFPRRGRDVRFSLERGKLLLGIVKNNLEFFKRVQAIFLEPVAFGSRSKKHLDTLSSVHRLLEQGVTSSPTLQRLVHPNFHDHLLETVLPDLLDDLPKASHRQAIAAVTAIAKTGTPLLEGHANKASFLKAFARHLSTLEKLVHSRKTSAE